MSKWALAVIPSVLNKPKDLHEKIAGNVISGWFVMILGVEFSPRLHLVSLSWVCKGEPRFSNEISHSL